MKDTALSIIVPIYNEEKILSKNLTFFKNLSRQAEVIFVDGGSSDKGPRLVKAYGKTLRSKKGRAAQMNYGGRYAIGNVLLFLHADATVSATALKSIIHRMADKNFVGGVLTQQINKKGFAYRLIGGLGNIRAQITKVFYGDQGIFVRRSVFLKLGGFPEVSIMEDVLFTKKLRKAGKILVLPDKIMVSARRWDTKGIMKTIFLHCYINILFHLKIPLAKIKILYSDLR